MPQDLAMRTRRAKAVALMHGTGAVLCAASVSTPGSVPDGAWTTAFWTTAVLCTITAALAWVRGPRLSVATASAALLLGQAMIAVVTVNANGREAANADLLLMLWPTLGAAIFFSRRFVVVQLVGCCLVAAVVFRGAESGVGVALIQSAVMISSLAIAAYVVLKLREQLAAAADEMQGLSRTDHLTGLANRRGLEEMLPTVWATAGRRSEAVAVLLLDVDHFKQVNDAHGHAVGDRVLEQVAAVARAHLRLEDVLARSGGEEFVVVLSGSCGAGEVLAERLRAAVEAAPLAVAATVSIGVASRRPGLSLSPLEDFSALLAAADGAMYAAKDAGRNKVKSAPDAALTSNVRAPRALASDTAPTAI